MRIGDRPYFYKEVPDLTLLVNEAKKFRLTKTKFSSHRHEISSLYHELSFRFFTYVAKYSPTLQNNKCAKISPLFLSETKVYNFLVKIREFRSYWRSSAYTSYMHSTVLYKRCFTACSGNAALRKKYRHVDIGIDEVSSNYFLEYQLHSFEVLLSKSAFAKIESSITYFQLLNWPNIEKTRFSLHIWL